MSEAAVYDILGAGAGGPLAPPTPWQPGVGFIYYTNGGIVVGYPAGVNKGVGAINAQSYYINGVLVDLTKYLPYTGGTLTGILTLSGDPIGNMDAVTKRYVDTKIVTVNGTFASYLPLAGGTLTGALTMSAGALTLAAAPTADLQAVTKKYVDDKLTGLIAVPDAPSDGTYYFRGGPVGGPNTWANIVDAGTF